RQGCHRVNRPAARAIEEPESGAGHDAGRQPTEGGRAPDDAAQTGQAPWLEVEDGPAVLDRVGSQLRLRCRGRRVAHELEERDVLLPVRVPVGGGEVDAV